MKHYGAAYSTYPDTFGEIVEIFEVPSDWDGYRFHGYCRPTAEEVKEFFEVEEVFHKPLD